MTEYEELLLLRLLVEKQKNELAQNAKTIEQNIKIIEQQNIRIENMVQALLHANKKLFGASSEASKQLDGQMSLFETTLELAKELFNEQKKITVSGYTKTPRQPGVRAEMLAGLPKEIEEYIINPDENCSVCGGKLKVIGKKLIRTEVEFIPSRIKVIQIVQQVAKCMGCGTDGSENPNDHFQNAAIPTSVLSHSIATASLVAQVIYQKFLMGMPLNRQEKDWYRMGLVLPRGNMANWVIRCSEDWMKPIYDRIHTELLKCEILHMDETRIQCNKEEGKKASSNSFMWIMRSGASENITAAFFHYSRTRSGDVAKALLDGYHNYLTTDAYIGYEKATGIKRNLCWAHTRRYMIESIPLDSSGKEIPGSKGAEGKEFINLLFKLEEEMKELTYEKKKAKRQVASRAILDAFWSWIEETAVLSTTNEKLTKALTYATNQRKYLETLILITIQI